MKISIVTPSLNRGSYIQDAIESVASQDYPNKEHLIFDALSSDQTIGVLKEVDYLPHLSWVAEPDKGQSDAINKGFRAATGDIVAWLNADDYYLPGTFSKVAKFFETHPDIDILYGDTLFVDQDKQFLRYKKDHPFDYNLFLYYGCFIQTTSTFFRRKIIDQNDLLDVSFKAAMDYEYFVRLANLDYRFEYMPEVFGAFRWHDENVSRVFIDKSRRECRQVLDQYGFKLSQNEQINRRLHRLAALFYRGKRRFLRLKAVLSI